MHKTFTLKDGREILLRPVTPQDAPELKAYINAVAGESDYLSMGAGELTLSDEQEVSFIQNTLSGPNAIMLAAVCQGKIIANANLRGDSKKRMRHIAEMGITVSREFWGLGIGRFLMDELIAFARQTGELKIIHLAVRADNERAVRLYKSFGFETLGLYKKMFMLSKTYFDGILMNLYL